VEAEKVGAFKGGAARFDVTAGLEQFEHRHAGDRLARAAFPNKAKDFTGIDIEADATNCLNLAAAGEEGCAEVSHGKDWPAHPRNLGSRASRRPSPRKLKANMVREIAAA